MGGRSAASSVESGDWRTAFAGAPFAELRELRFPNPQHVSRDELVGYFRSMSWIASLPDDEREPLLAEVRDALADTTYTRHWETQLHWARRATI